MQISVTGNNRGFTLIELVVVVFIIALVSTVVVQNVGGHRHQRLAKDVGERFVAAFEFANDEALLEQAAYGLVIKGSSYYFVRYDPYQGAWTDLSYDKVLGHMSLPAGLELKFAGNSQITNERPLQDNLTPDIMLSPNQILAPFTLDIVDGDEVSYSLRYQQGSLQLID